MILTPCSTLFHTGTPCKTPKKSPIPMISFVQKRVVSMAPLSYASLFFSHSVKHEPAIHNQLHIKDSVMFQLNQIIHVVFQFSPDNQKSLLPIHAHRLIMNHHPLALCHWSCIDTNYVALYLL